MLITGWKAGSNVCVYVSYASSIIELVLLEPGMKETLSTRCGQVLEQECCVIMLERPRGDGKKKHRAIHSDRRMYGMYSGKM